MQAYQMPHSSYKQEVLLGNSDLFKTIYFPQEIHDYKMRELLRRQYISLDDDLRKDYIASNMDVIEELSYKEKKLLEDLAYMQVGLIGGLIVLYIAPESVSKWTPEQKKLHGIEKKWKENVKAGPIVDSDEFFINYVGHPVSGAYYYTLARNDGYEWFGSFMFSAFVSTFVWEYGYEAFAEIPSTQDLILTPVLGSLLGEWFYHLEKKLDENNGILYGSRTLGNIAYTFLNPLGRMSETLSETFGLSTTMRFQTYQTSAMIAQDNSNRPQQYDNHSYGVFINFEF